METEWDDKLTYLQAVRHGWCNADYMEFLIHKVWRIEQAVDMVDFGCGFGYMGLLLMPLLPQGSTYTGIDKSAALLRETEKLFSENPYTVRLIHADLMEYEPHPEYDMAISQAVLRHIPNPRAILDKMVQSVKPGGWIICMETDRVLEEAGRYISNLDYTGLKQRALYHKIWEYELAAGGRDYRIGLKIPQYMQELGLRDIDIRINDRVRFANPHAGDYDSVYHAMAEANGWNRTYGTEDIQKYKEAMMEKGLTREEAARFVENEMTIQRHVREGYGQEYIMQMACTPISFGRK